MHTLLAQTRKAAEVELHYLALMSAPTMPAIAGALESADGAAKGARYAAWYEQRVLPRNLYAAPKYLKNAAPLTHSGDLDRHVVGEVPGQQEQKTRRQDDAQTGAAYAANIDIGSDSGERTV